MPTATKPDREVLIQRSNGQQQLIRGIPATSKLTYGPVNPGKQGYGANCLRIYTAGNNQLAVFTDVSWFRDTSLIVRTRKKSEKQNREAEHGPKGSKVASHTEETYEWVDGDTEDPGPQALYPPPLQAF